MAVTRSQLLGGPVFAAWQSKNIQYVGDVKLECRSKWEDVETALYGKIDQYQSDYLIKVTGVPRYYDTAQLAIMWPYLAAPMGKFYPTSSDLPLVLNSNNGDINTIESAVVTKMPDLTLGVGGPVLGELELTGIIVNTDDPSASNSYTNSSTGNAYTAPTLASSAAIGNQEFTATWGSITGFDTFQAQDQWTITHELGLEAVVIQGRTRAFRVTNYRCMAKCKPLGPTMAQIDANLFAQGSGAGGGYRGSTNGASLVIAGANSMTITLGGAYMVGYGFVFGSKPLRQGEIGWISSLPTVTAALALA